MRRAAALALALAAVLAGCGGEEEREPPASAGPDPIVFVHGFGGSGDNFDQMAARFRRDGWPAERLRQWSYESRRSNAVTARALRDEVAEVLEATGARKVDVVTHSMGGLSSRHFAKTLGGARLIDRWVSLGGPNHGTAFARLCAQPACLDMRPGSPFLRALNAGDETPGAARYGTWWSPCDEVIDPASSTRLAGARNTRLECVGHGALLVDARVYRQVRDFVRP